MSQRVAIGRAAPVTLTTAVKQILPLNRAHTGTGYPRELFIASTDVDVVVVTALESTDGGTVPASGAFVVKTSEVKSTYDISGAQFLGLAAVTGTGTVTIEIR